MTDRHPKAKLVPPHPGVDLLEDEVVWAERFALQKVRFRYTRFDGEKSGILTWELWRRGQGVGILPYDPWADTVALIEQFRLPALAAGFNPMMVECAAGLLEAGEDAAEAARREAAEETGLTLDHMQKIGRFMLMQGGCDEVMHLFCGRTRLPEAGSTSFHGLPEENEDIKVTIRPAEEAFAMLDDGRIQNATAALVLYWLRTHRTRLRQEWSA